jgi:hypothetical protein
LVLLALMFFLRPAPAQQVKGQVRYIATLPPVEYDNPHSPDNVLSFGVTCAIQI